MIFLNEIKIYHGTSYTRSMKIIDSNNDPYVHEQNDIVMLTVKHNILQSDYDIQKTASYDAETDTYTFEFTPEDTENLMPDRYYYDIGLQNGNDFYIIVPMSNFDILPASSQRSGE